uniref:Uncharacterized protein n=1 Tax=Guillardia theta TaxID=55529 RepID=A0A7S4KBP3_GUITH
MGTSDRFLSPGSYLSKSTKELPGPGSYSSSVSPKPSSRNGTLGSVRSMDRLDFGPKGEGADAVYDAKVNTFSSKGGTRGFGSSERFGKFGAYIRSDDCPGPGSYTPKAAAKQPHVEGRASPPRSPSTRLDFTKISGASESPGPIYTVRSSFDNSTKAERPTSAFGSSDRFQSVGSYLSMKDVPGPGTYQSESPLRSQRSSGPPSSPSTARRASSDRINFGPRGEGAEPAYKVQSSFEKAAAKRQAPSSSFGTSGRFDRHGSYIRGELADSPGPGTYVKEVAVSSKGLQSPPRRQTTPSKERLNFGPSGEGAAHMYNIPSSFEQKKSSATAKSVFGTSSRFDGVGSYTSRSSAPGPGSYSSRPETIKKSSPAASFASPRMRPPGWNKRLETSVQTVRSSLSSSR